MKKLNKKFFSESPEIVAKKLLGKTLAREINGKILKAKIVETEAYFGDEDPASRAYKGKNKISELMWHHPGTILIYNVHKYLMLNLVTSEKGIPSAVLIRALEPLNFEGRCSGPGLLTNCLKINKSLHGESISGSSLYIIDTKESPKIQTSFRIGVTKDLPDHFRFFIKENKFVSRYKST